MKAKENNGLSDQPELEAAKYAEYSANYSESDFEDKIRSFGKKLGGKICGEFFFLRDLVKDKNSPLYTTKKQLLPIIIGVLGYFILPVDVIPDFIPVAGLSDDALALATVIKLLSGKEFEPFRTKAKEEVNNLFK